MITVGVAIAAALSKKFSPDILFIGTLIVDFELAKILAIVLT